MRTIIAGTVILLAACSAATAQAQSTNAAGGFKSDILSDFDKALTNLVIDFDKTYTNIDATVSGRPAELSGCEVQCAALTYAGNQRSKCFASRFLSELSSNTNVRTQPSFVPVSANSGELFKYPFSVLSGEGAFQLTGAERENLRHYLENGGFLLASAGCSSKPWADSFRVEVKNLFPGREMVKVAAEHPIFHTVFDIKESHYKVGKDRFPDIFGIEIDGRMVMLFSPDGLNDTSNAGKGCCCCGGNEIKSAREINVNVLAYALTH